MVDSKSDDDQYNKWKVLIPYLYDWFANHNLTWPSLSCRYGTKRRILRRILAYAAILFFD